MIRLLQHSFTQAEQNIACEERLLAPMIKTVPEQALVRIWDNEEASIVLGRAEKAKEQVHLQRASELGVKVLRRTSGGGTVVHGPGNLNLSFFLPYHMDERLKSIHDSYQLIIGWVRKALLEAFNCETNMKGSSDISIGDLKISGTAQARKRHGLLHHLTLLVDFDTSNISELLQEPAKRPDYRGERVHRQFVTTLSKAGFQWDRQRFIEQLGIAMGDSWQETELNPNEHDDIEKLCLYKYRQDHWNLEGEEPAKEHRLSL